MVDRWSGGATAPVVASGSPPAWTATVSMRMNDLGLVLDLDAERGAVALRVPDVALPVEQLEPFAQPQIAVQVEGGVLRVVDPRVDADRAAERPEQRGDAELGVEDAGAHLQVLRPLVHQQVIGRVIAEIVGAEGQV